MDGFQSGSIFIYMSPANQDKLKITRIDSKHQAQIHTFLANIFSSEQNIPTHMIPIDSDHVYWWGILDSPFDILGVVATWKEKDGWHWGRFSIHTRVRGKGLGKKLAKQSLIESFELAMDRIIIDARDAVVHIIEQFGGVVCGETEQFFSENITPMILERENFNLTV